MRHLIFCMLFSYFLMINCFALDNFSQLEVAFTAIDAPNWSGPANFLEKIKKSKVNPCQFITKMEKKFEAENVFLLRVLLLASETNCPIKEHLSEKYLTNSDPLIVANAILVATSLPKAKRTSFRKIIVELKKTTKDSLVIEKCDYFLQKL